MRDLSIQAFSRGKDYALKLRDRLPKRKPGKQDLAGLPAGKKKPRRLPEIIVIKKKGGSPEVEILPENSDASLVTANDAAAWYDLPAVKKTAKRPRLIRRERISRRRVDKTNEPAEEQVCAQCGRTSSSEARFCQYCGATFEAAPNSSTV
jgi:hypothetical protein